VEEARRRAAMEEPQADQGPSTRSSWLPPLKLPSVRRLSTKNIAGVESAIPSAAQQNFAGGSTLRWQPNGPSEPTAWPVLSSNVVVDPEYLASASGAGSSAEGRVTAAVSGRGVAEAERAGMVIILSTPVMVSGSRPASAPHTAGALHAPRAVRDALATIDAAAAQRSAWLQRVPEPAQHSKSSEQGKDAALDVLDAAIPLEQGRDSASHDAQAAQQNAGSPERNAQPNAMRSPSLTAAPGNAAAGPSRAAPVIATAGAVTSARAEPAQPVAAEPALRLDPQPPRAAEKPQAFAAPREQIFRENAVRAKSEQPIAQPLPEVTGSGWSVLLVLSTLLILGLGLAYLGRVEQTSIASGVLQVSGGPRPVLAQTSGLLLSLEVRPGDSVQQGQAIARIDATDLNAREQRDVAQLALATTEKERISAAELGRLQADQRAFRQKRALLEERARLKGDAVRDRGERMEQVQHAAYDGVATQGDALAVREAERAAAEDLLLIRQQITETDLQLTEVQKNYQGTVERLRHDIDSASNSLAETRTLLQTTEVRAPVSGRVESLQVAQGQVIGSGTVLARIVPDGTITSAVVFASAKDASFLRAGLEASLEFASLPVSEFGKAAARVTRVSQDVASSDEIMSALGRGLEEPVIRVELALLPSDQLTRVQDKLRSGERLTARLNMRDRRMITLLFDFLRKWYAP
jgi:multidrug resistance efflux pump